MKVFIGSHEVMHFVVDVSNNSANPDENISLFENISTPVARKVKLQKIIGN